MPLLFQIGFGLSAFKSGLLLLASALGNLGMKALTTRILERWGFRAVAVVDASIAGLSMIAFGALALRIAASFHGETSGQVFTLDDFHLAFLSAGLLTPLSVWGYAQIAHDAGRNVGGGSRRQRAWDECEVRIALD